jgi:hypothetical protein
MLILNIGCLKLFRVQGPDKMQTNPTLFLVKAFITHVIKHIVNKKLH